MEREKISKVAADLRALADSIEALCGKPEEVLEKQEVTLEAVRAVLADKSRSGKAEGVREIIRRHGADRLSAIPPEEFSAVLEEAEAL